MTVLLVDDDQDQLDLRTLLLEKNGLQAIAATTATTAIKEAKAQQQQCAVLDLKIPTEAAGLGLIRELKALDAGIRLFVLTGSDAKRINMLPEMALVEEVILKGSPIAYLLKTLKNLANAEDSAGKVWRVRK